MLIAIASDLHDNLANWQVFNDYLKEQEIKVLLFCGDLCNEESLEHIASSFSGDFYYIAGNGELYNENDQKKYPNLRFLGRYGGLELDNLSIGLIHEPEFRNHVEKKFPKLDFIFYGHTHKPWLENDSGLIIANPGTLGGVYYPASFAILDTENKNLSLKTLF